jgi:hypothetical protein
MPRTTKHLAKLACVVAGVFSVVARNALAFDADSPTLVSKSSLIEDKPIPFLDQTAQPVIGILTQPWKEDGGDEYIPSGYVKFVEQAGARVVAIQFSLPDDELRRRLGEIHGVLFPGGDNDLTPGASRFMQAAAVVWEHKLAAHKRGQGTLQLLATIYVAGTPFKSNGQQIRQM